MVWYHCAEHGAHSEYSCPECLKLRYAKGDNMNPVITEIQKLIERHENDNPLYNGDVLIQIDYVNGVVESIEYSVVKTITIG